LPCGYGQALPPQHETDRPTNITRRRRRRL
jgi:hypothetical protein